MVVSNGELRVLIVEDHDPTARLIATVLEDAVDSLSTDVVSNGEACLDILKGDVSDMPDLVLLDLDLPVTDGQTVLKRREEETSIRRVPTIVFSNTDTQKTIQECYEQGANAFISKPDDLNEYESVAERITQFWFCSAALPRA